MCSQVHHTAAEKSYKLERVEMPQFGSRTRAGSPLQPGRSALEQRDLWLPPWLCLICLQSTPTTLPVTEIVFEM